MILGELRTPDGVVDRFEHTVLRPIAEGAADAVDSPFVRQSVGQVFEAYAGLSSSQRIGTVKSVATLRVLERRFVEQTDPDAVFLNRGAYAKLIDLTQDGVLHNRVPWSFAYAFGDLLFENEVVEGHPQPVLDCLADKKNFLFSLYSERWGIRYDTSSRWAIDGGDAHNAARSHLIGMEAALGLLS